MSKESAQHGDPGALSDLATALTLYLEEIDDDSNTCRRYEATIGVAVEGRDVRLTRQFCWTRAIRAALQRAVAGLPGWRQSPFWVSDGEHWNVLETAALARAPRVPGGGGIVRGIAWHGRPILVSARAAGSRQP